MDRIGTKVALAVACTFIVAIDRAGQLELGKGVVRCPRTSYLGGDVDPIPPLHDLWAFRESRRRVVTSTAPRWRKPRTIGRPPASSWPQASVAAAVGLAGILECLETEARGAGAAELPRRAHITRPCASGPPLRPTETLFDLGASSPHPRPFSPSFLFSHSFTKVALFSRHNDSPRATAVAFALEAVDFHVQTPFKTRK